VANIEVADKLQTLQSEAQRAGEVLGGDLVRRASQLEDNIKRLGAAFDLARTDLVAGFLPGLVRFSEEMVQGVRISGGWINALLVMGRINPFKDVAQNIREISNALEQNNAELARSGLLGPNPLRRKILEVDNDEKRKQLEFLKFQQRAAALENAAAMGDVRDARDRMLSKRDAPAIADKTEKLKKELEVTARSVEDYEARINQALAGAINESAFVKTRELEDVLARLDQMFFDGQIGVDVYDSAVQKLTGTLSKAKAPADELADLLRRTPSALQAEANRLTTAIDEAFFSGDISAKQQDELLALVNGYRNVEKAINGVDDAGRVLTINLNSALESLIFDTNKSVSAMGVLSAAIQDVGRSIFQSQVSKPISDAASKGLSFVGKGISDFIGGLFANAEGGLYKVAGIGGVDSQVVAMRATPGETVAVFPPGRGNSGGAGGPSFYVDMRGASVDAVADLRRLVLQVNGSLESRAVAAVSGARARGRDV
jgi:hypothetical protein